MTPTPQMDVLYMKDQGHVLGIFTRASEPATLETDASAFVGSDGLHLRALVAGQDLIIPPGLVSIFRTDRNWRQIFQPLTLYVSGLPNAPAVALFPGADITVTPATPAPPSPVTITITPPVIGIAVNILVFVLNTAGGTPIQFSTQLAATQASVAIAVTGLVSGDTYNAFVFFPGYPVRNASFLVP